MKNFVDMYDVSLRYGEDGDGTLALQNATIRVDSGEFVAVVGPSGCGKSTLMKVITGLWPPTSGGVIVDGKEVVAPLSITGMAFQNPTLLPWRTALANVLLPLEIVQPHASKFRRQRKAYEAKARDLLALVGLKGFEQKSPWELSGGMQQRVSMCRALIHDPSLLMLDEPFGALDMFTREELWLAMQELWLARRPTVILVTHDLREAVFLADRIFVMSARPGRMIAERTVELPRPRAMTVTYEPYAVKLVQDLRDHISAAREAA
ncbi:MAG TPA: ABC transporter ATP-binding protein [Xanthobacteraceae bacterium]|jgi:NitT/TauT family transport system ATP-binding protein|nr:ABC transporter ATP-binding protein [Xanthobacteraceae bacterium]